MWIRLAVLGCLITFLPGCPRPPAAKSEPPPAPVTVAVSQVKDVPIQVRAIGSVKVIATVAVRPRVSGELTEVYFKEGDDVIKGQKLFTIDPRPYESAMKQAQGNLAKNSSILAGAERDLKRIEGVNVGGAVSGVELDNARTAVQTARAAVAADEAALSSARIQLSFTSIVSPIDGRTGSLLVTAGNLVATGDAQPLVVINQISPIYVSFSIPEDELLDVTAASSKNPPVVEVRSREGESPVKGKLVFIDNAVDSGTGTIQLKGEFPNKDRKLWPGQFVDVILTLGMRKESVTVPMSAVQTGQQGRYVFVITKDQSAELRPVTVAFEYEGESVIASGLKGGESVVTTGQLRLAPGVKIAIKNGS